MNENEQTGVIEVRPKRVRRVGSVTMGISLICTGIVSIICLMNPSFDVMQVTKFSPIMLILLGFEFLWASFAKEQECVKYDFFSIFMCFMLICAVLAMTAGLMAFQHYMKINIRI
ncbi:hypothetical protein SDC9_143215 [bioreactor metagenome]|uniref:Uncharacterized protein n=1 Tax=bioreactor metagenome TaxID=1076179 RepID=A0A645E3E7_9ZZZZ|nr:hypothetical protein [Lachnospiraceae bacterium]